MAKYDGLIIPRSYNDYINKSDPLGVSQALQLTGVMDDTPTPGSSKPVKSNGLVGLSAVDVVETGNMHPVTSNAVAETAADLEPVDEVTSGNMHSVTSSAVYDALLNEDTQNFTTQYKNDNFTFTKVGKIVYMQSIGDWVNLPSQQSVTLFGLPSKYYPKKMVVLREQSNQNISVFINTDGTVSVYCYDGASSALNGNYIGCWVAAN